MEKGLHCSFGRPVLASAGVQGLLGEHYLSITGSFCLRVMFKLMKTDEALLFEVGLLSSLKCHVRKVYGA